MPEPASGELDLRIRKLRDELRQFDSAEVFKQWCSEGFGQKSLPSYLDSIKFDPSCSYHLLSEALVAPSPIDNETLIQYGPAAHPNFRVIIPAWQAHSDLLAWIAGEIELGSEGRNITIVTNHSNVIDIGLVLGALRYALNGIVEANLFSERSTLIISRFVTATALKLPSLGMMQSVVEILRLFTHVAFSFPTTQSVRAKRHFPDGLIPLANELVKLELKRRRNIGGHVLAIAPSASRDMILRDRVAMQPLHHGTMQLMRGWVVPVAITLDTQSPGCTVLPPRVVKTDADCHAIMHEIAAECHRQSLVPHKYHEQETLMDRVRDQLSP